jgi:hypothetical protein
VHVHGSRDVSSGHVSERQHVTLTSTLDATHGWGRRRGAAWGARSVTLTRVTSAQCDADGCVSEVR